jgi:hypothetical protein
MANHRLRTELNAMPGSGDPGGVSGDDGGADRWWGRSVNKGLNFSAPFYSSIKWG